MSEVRKAEQIYKEKIVDMEKWKKWKFLLEKYLELRLVQNHPLNYSDVALKSNDFDLIVLSE
jgi:hypothetical protein